MKVVLGIFVLVIAATLQSSAGLFLSRLRIDFDFLLVSCVCAAMLSGLGPAVAVAVCAGLFKDALSTASGGYSVAVFVPISIVISSIRKRIWAAHWVTQAGCASAATLCAWLLYGILLKASGRPLEWSGFGVLSRAAVNALIAPPLFKIWQAVLR